MGLEKTLQCLHFHCKIFLMFSVQCVWKHNISYRTLGVILHDNNGYQRISNDLFGVRAYYKLSKAGSAIRTHYNQVDLLPLHKLVDLSAYRAEDYLTNHLRSLYSIFRYNLGKRGLPSFFQILKKFGFETQNRH